MRFEVVYVKRWSLYESGFRARTPPSVARGPQTHWCRGGSVRRGARVTVHRPFSIGSNLSIIRPATPGEPLLMSVWRYMRD